MRRRIARILALAALAMLAATPAFAHAVVIEANPAPGETVPGPDIAATLRYNGRIDHARSRLTLVSPDGATKRIAITPKAAPDTLAAALTGLGPGTYRLRWQVLSVDGHITRGEVPFRVTAP